MSDTIINQQNEGGKGSNYQSILSKNTPAQQPKNIYRSGLNPVVNNSSSYLSFAQRVEQSPYLVSFEQQNKSKKSKKPPKKVINSYISNKDKLIGSIFIIVPSDEGTLVVKN